MAGVSRDAKTFMPEQNQYLAFIHLVSAMYQVYVLQKRAADRIQDFAHFAQTSHSSVEDGYRVA